MDKEQLLIEYLNKNGYIKSSEAKSIGISRAYLYQLEKKGSIVNQQKGLFTLPVANNITEYDSFIEVSKIVPDGIISLFSALSIHNVTTQLSSEIWLTLPRGKWQPSIQYPPVHYITAVESVYAYGIEDIKIGNHTLKVYSPAKTVADCFKYRNKIGIDVAIEALREVWIEHKATMDELVEAAKVCRVLNVMKPYMEAVV